MGNIIVRVFQASRGDSFLITINEEKEINILIDCGLEETYKQHIKPVLLMMKAEGRKLDYLILTHTHSDHIGGAIPLLIENKSFGHAEIIKIDNIFYNGFLGLSLEKYETRECDAIEKLVYRGICANGKSILANTSGQEAITLNEELCLSKLIDQGGYNWNGSNKECPQLILSDGENKIKLGQHTNMYILSPMKKNLHNMNIKWEQYLKRISSRIDYLTNDLVKEAYEAFLLIVENEEYEQISQMIGNQTPDDDDVQKLAEKKYTFDYTYENSSSIAILLEAFDKRMLFLGDSNPGIYKKSLNCIFPKDDIVQIDLIKLAHHGSIRNLSDEFLNKYVTDRYIISSGLDCNRPSVETMAKLLYFSPKSKKKFYITNKNSAMEAIDNKNNHEKYNFEFIDIADESIYL